MGQARAEKPKALTADVGLLRVVVRRFAPRSQRILIRRPVVAVASCPRQRQSSPDPRSAAKQVPVQRNVRHGFMPVDVGVPLNSNSA